VGINQYDVFCGVVVNGVRLDQPYCRSAEKCVEEILRDYKRELERLREPPEPALVIKIDPVEELLREWPELQAFGVDWVRKWLDLRERLIEIAETLRRFPWIVEVVRQRPMRSSTPTRWRCMWQRTGRRRVSRSPRRRRTAPKTAP
jgi:hypothetical protein